MTDIAPDMSSRIVRSPIPDVESPDLPVTDYDAPPRRCRQPT